MVFFSWGAVKLFVIPFADRLFLKPTDSLKLQQQLQLQFNETQSTDLKISDVNVDDFMLVTWDLRNRNPI